MLLSIVQQETISAITVKLEGESRTRLAGVIHPRGQYDGFQKDQVQLEIHKVYLCCRSGYMNIRVNTIASFSMMSKLSSLPLPLQRHPRSNNIPCPLGNMNILSSSRCAKRHDLDDGSTD